LAPTAPPGCGAVEVDDRSDAPSPEHVSLVRDALRQQLAVLGACAPKYRVHVDLKLEPTGESHLRVRLLVVVYAKDGALAADIPTTVSGTRASAQDTADTDELLRAGAEEAAHAFAKHFH
jgi:hypothetical protein